MVRDKNWPSALAGGENIYLINPDGTNKILFAIKTKTFEWSPNGEWIAYEDSKGFWVVSSTDKKDKRYISFYGGYWLSDSQHICCPGGVINIETFEIEYCLLEGGVISPDGKKVAVFNLRDLKQIKDLVKQKVADETGLFGFKKIVYEKDLERVIDEYKKSKNEEGVKLLGSIIEHKKLYGREKAFSKIDTHKYKVKFIPPSSIDKKKISKVEIVGTIQYGLIEPQKEEVLLLEDKDYDGIWTTTFAVYPGRYSAGFRLNDSVDVPDPTAAIFKYYESVGAEDVYDSLLIADIE